MTFEQPNRSGFYFEYHRIGNKSFRDKVRYYEENRAQLQTLHYEERIEVDMDYALCLFEIGKYHRFLSHVDPLIETIIMDNIFTFNGVNIYNDFLFKKAACLYNTGQYIKAESILKALVKMDGENDMARLLYGKCKRKQERNWYEAMKAIAMVFLISAISIAVMELLIVRPFYNDYVATFRGMKIFFFISAFLALIANELYLNYVIGKEIGHKYLLQDFKKRLGL